MAIIQVPAKSIVGKPKLNIANDNTYESVGYSKKSTNFSFTSFYSKKLEILNVYESVINNNSDITTPRWTSVFNGDIDRVILKNDNTDSTTKVYEHYNGSSDFKLIPIAGGGWYNYAVKFTISKPDINFDYSKTEFGYSIDYKYSQLTMKLNEDETKTLPYIKVDSYNQSDYSTVNITPIPTSLIYDDSKTDLEMFEIIGIDSNFSEVTGSSGGIAPKFAIRMSNETIDVFLTAGAIAGNKQSNYVSMLYPIQTFEFYYRNIENIDLGQVNESSKYSLPDNELLAEQTTYNGTSIYDQISNSIVSEYEKGKFSVDLTCLYMQYSGANFADTIYTGQDGQMVSVGDIIIPCKVGDVKFYGENVALRNPALAVNKNNVPYAFKVIKSEIDTTDSQYIKNNITAVELSGSVTINVNIDAYEYQRGLKMFINGQEVDWYTTQKINAQIGDLLEFEYEDNYNSSHEIRIAGAIGFSESTGIHFGKGRRAKFCVYNDGMTITLEY